MMMRTVLPAAALLLLACSFGACTYEPMRPLNETKAKAAKPQIDVIVRALRSFRSDTKRFPDTSEGLEALVLGSGIIGWKGPYLESVPLDPWGHIYSYRYPGAH